MKKVKRILPSHQNSFNESWYTFNSGGLQNSHLIEKSLIDVYVPFLPMEKSHVRLCAENEFKKQNHVPKNIDLWDGKFKYILSANYISNWDIECV